MYVDDKLGERGSEIVWLEETSSPEQVSRIIDKQKPEKEGGGKGS